MTSTTRAALERLIETWRQTAYAVERVAAYTPEARAYDVCADELAALLAAEGPSQVKSQVAPISLASHVAGLGLDDEGD
jgi:hypothetical protein